MDVEAGWRYPYVEQDRWRCLFSECGKSGDVGMSKQEKKKTVMVTINERQEPLGILDASLNDVLEGRENGKNKAHVGMIL